MKKILALLIALLPSLALAQSSIVIRNDNAATTTQNTNLQPSKLSVNNKGQLFAIATINDGTNSLAVIPVSGATSLNGLGVLNVVPEYIANDAVEAGSTTTVINATAHVARVGDIVEFLTGTAGNIKVWSTVSAVGTNTITLAKALPATPAAADTFDIKRLRTVTYPSSANAAYTSYPVSIDYNGQGNTSRGLLKAEDAAHTSGDAGVQVLGVQNSSFATLNADGDYSSIATGRAGNVLSTLVRDDVLPNSRQPVQIEDVASASGDAGIPALGVVNTAGTVFTSTGGDYTNIALTTNGAQQISLDSNFAPSLATSPLKIRDSATGATDTGMYQLGIMQTGASPSNLADTNGDAIPFAANQKGASYVNLDFNYQNSAPNGLLKAEDSVAASGDAGVAILANVNTSYSSLASAGDYTTPAVNNLGAFYVSLDANMQGANASPVRKEDAAFADAEGLMVSGGVKQNSSPTSFGGTALDVTPVAVNSFGDIYVDLNSNHRENAAASVIKVEDAATGDGDAGISVLARVKGDFNASAADGDYAHINVDLDGRTAVNPWGADTSEFFDVCATATATTADVQLKAAVASNRIYISSIDCKNSSATTATNLDFKDGSGLRATGGIAQMATTSPGSFSVTFPKPLRGTINTDFNFATTVSVSSVACCAHGFISGN